MEKIVGCIGDLLVEIMREKIGVPLNVTGTFVGPFPSGASGIFIDAVARLGIKNRFVGSVGEDDFGKVILERFIKDGVDISHIKVMDDYTTGVAFVTYFEDGSRKFIYHLPRAAAGQIYPEDVEDDYFRDLDFIHIIGSTMLINDGSREACNKAIHIVKKSGGKICFDPNFRPELIEANKARELFLPVVLESNIFFPTEDEVKVLSGVDEIEKACRSFLDQGLEIIAVKKGSKGSHIFTPTDNFPVAPFKVNEIDPTGAGDCFCAGFIAGLINGFKVREAARFANAFGALAVTRKGPMEGVATYQEAIHFMESYLLGE